MRNLLTEIFYIFFPKFVNVDSRNPFKAIEPIFESEPLIVIASKFDLHHLSTLSKRFGYRYLIIEDGTLEEAIQKAKDPAENIAVATISFTIVKCNLPADQITKAIRNKYKS